MKNLIFDLDGTLLDTLEDIGIACNVTLDNHSYPTHPISAYNKMVGNGFEKLVRRALPINSGLEEEQILSIVSEAKDYYARHLYDKTRPYNDIPEVLSQLARSGKTLTVLSNKPDLLTKEIINHFFPNLPFAVIQGARPELPLKPSPESVLAIMDNFAWKPKESCYIGDSDVDIITGKNANLKTIGVCWGFRGREELAKENPDFLVEAPLELLKICR